MDKITIPDLNGMDYFIWELKMKAALSLKRLDSLILNEKPEDLTRKDEMDWITKNSDAIAYIKLSLADEQALQFAAEDNAKVLWDKIRATYIGEGEDRKIDAGNELKNIRMKNEETVADYIARARGISTKCHSLGLDVSPRELVYHTVRGLNGKFSKVRDILKTQRGKSMDEILQILREEATLNLPIKTRMDGINSEAFYSSHREEKLCDNIWILDSGASCHMAKESVWFKNISPEVMDIYLADKNSKMMSQGTGNVSAKTVSTKHGNSINLTITDVSYAPQLRCNLLSVTCLMDKGYTYLANSGIFHEKTIPYNSESNGKAERANRVLLERARSLLYESKLPLKFWAEAINCSTQVSNVTPRKGKEKIPLEIWTGNKPKLNYVKKFGCVAYFHVPKVLRNKFEVPGRRGIMLGYARERRGYRIYDIKNQKTTSSPRTGRIQIPVLELNEVQNQIPVRRSERLKSKLMSVHLVNNVPNSYFEVENSANWKNLKLAMENELDSLDKQKSYSPVVNIESFRLLIGLAAKLKLNVNFFDVKTAYLYGDLEETVYVLPPPGYEKLIGDDKVCKLKKSIYANRTRPNISFIMSYLSQFNHNPEKRHYNLAKRVSRYLMGSKDKKLFYENEFGILNASLDASWGNAENGKSFSGGVVLLGFLQVWSAMGQNHDADQALSPLIAAGSKFPSYQEV
ncbi:retrovirus-related Pol polyprotein from transposon TNT 1-94 [Trichonephila clavipes]|nr:retrovirus-related Pol polyprotein from transposon TNT 1-94 [Trichonephila clavipes]